MVPSGGLSAVGALNPLPADTTEIVHAKRSS